MNELFAKNTVTVTGTVFDQDMKAISGVNVTEVGTTNGTTTDKDGQFSIQVSSSAAQLKFSHVGYDYDTVSIADFNKLGYWQIYYAPETLPDVNVNGTGVKKSSNMILPILALVVIAALIASHSSKPKQVTP